MEVLKTIAYEVLDKLHKIEPIESDLDVADFYDVYNDDIIKILNEDYDYLTSDDTEVVFKYLDEIISNGEY